MRAAHKLARWPCRAKVGVQVQDMRNELGAGQEKTVHWWYMGVRLTSQRGNSGRMRHFWISFAAVVYIGSGGRRGLRRDRLDRLRRAGDQRQVAAGVFVFVVVVNGWWCA